VRASWRGSAGGHFEVFRGPLWEDGIAASLFAMGWREGARVAQTASSWSTGRCLIANPNRGEGSEVASFLHLPVVVKYDLPSPWLSLNWGVRRLMRFENARRPSSGPRLAPSDWV